MAEEDATALAEQVFGTWFDVELLGWRESAQKSRDRCLLGDSPFTAARKAVGLVGSDDMSDIEAAFDKWGGMERPDFESDTYRMIQLAFAEGWRARGRRDVDVVRLLQEERADLSAAADGLVKKKVDEDRPLTKDEANRVLVYAGRIWDIDHWLDAAIGAT